MSGRRGRSAVRRSASAARSRDISPAELGQSSKRPRRVLENVPKNWTSKKLCEEIELLGLEMTPSVPHKTLLSVYEQLRTKQASTLVNQDGATLELDLNSEMLEILVPVSRMRESDTSPVNNESQNGGLRDEIGSLQATVAELTRQVGLNTNKQSQGQSILLNNSTPTMSSTQIKPRKPMDEMPDTTIVSDTNRKLIMSNKHVNLASLLIPGIENTSDQTKIIDAHGNQIVVKSNDPRLMRMLSIDEFRTAFHKFIDVICDATEGSGGDPSRLHEFLKYMEFIGSLHIQFGGFHFYEYHNLFSRKAEQLEAKGHPVDWSCQDTKTYLKIFAGLKSSLCNLCNSATHDSNSCHMTNHTTGTIRQDNLPHFNHSWTPNRPPLPSNGRNEWSPNSNHTWTPSQQRLSQQNNQGGPNFTRSGRRDERSAKYWNGKEICSNFNNWGCALNHNSFFKIAHVCERCFSSNHGARQCTKPGKQF